MSRGFRATTAEVAARAGVSEGSLFKRFRSKFELFQAAMGSLDDLPPFADGLIESAGSGDLPQKLFDLGQSLSEHLRRVVPLHLMAWSNPGPDGAPQMYERQDAGPLAVIKILAGYFAAEMRAGRLARRDPEIVARTFIGAVHNFVVVDLLFRAQDTMPMPEETFLRGLIDLLLRGMDLGGRK